MKRCGLGNSSPPFRNIAREGRALPTAWQNDGREQEGSSTWQSRDVAANSTREDAALICVKTNGVARAYMLILYRQTWRHFWVRTSLYLPAGR